MKPVDLHINFHVIDEKRRQAGLKMWEAAERLNVSESTLSHIKSGLSISVPTLLKIAKGLGVSPKTLLREGDELSMPVGDARIDFAVLYSERKARGWSYSVLAMYADLSPATIFKAKKGRAVSYRTLTKLAQALDVNPRDLVLKDGDNNDES